MKNLLFTVALLISLNSVSQKNIINGKIEGYPEKYVYFMGFDGNQSNVFDSIRTDQMGGFRWNLNDEDPGLFRIIFGNDKFLDIIVNNESFSFNTTYSYPKDDVKFSVSKENSIFYDYLNKRNENQFKLELLTPLVAQYPQNEEFYKEAEKEYIQLQDNMKNYTNSVIENNPDLLVSKFIHYDKPHQIDLSVPFSEQDEYLKKHYFDDLNFDDPVLLNLNVLPGKIIGYLSLYRDPSLAKVLQEELFRQAVDSILHKTMNNEEIYYFSLQYLIDGFQMYGFDNLVDHIGKTYTLDKTCVNEERKSELEKRMDNIRKLSAGNNAPDIKIINTNEHSSPQWLSQIDSDYKLVLFWSSWCPHCKSIIPGLRDYYNQVPREKFEIISISVDTSATGYQKVSDELSIPWISFADFKGWNTQAAIDYSIYATPMMILVDKDLKIIYKPSGIAELKTKMEEFLQ